MRPMLEKGEKIAHYTIVRLLGAGGMGQVYLALDERLHRNVALKVLLETAIAEEARDSAARLLREARAAASLTHPNVVSVFDVGEADGRVFLAMEMVVGKTLRDLMLDAELPWQRRLRWLVDVARALGAAHRSGLVHRDIKPENVMVRDEDGLVKVLDFGIARRAGPTENVDPTAKTQTAHLGGAANILTGKGLVLGTPMYMAPEQLKGGAPDPRTDQFSWGVMCFEVLTGERPWPAKSDLLAAVATILTEAPESLRKKAPEVPHAVEAVVARALSRDPTQRFDTMDDVADLLEPLAIRNSSSELSAPTARPSDKSLREGPSNTEASRVAESAPGGSTTKGAMVTVKSPEHPNQPVQAERPKRRRWHFLLGAAVALGSVGLWAKFHRTGTPTPVPSASVRTPASNARVPPPPPLTENEEALSNFQEGMQLWRDGSAIRSHARFERAATLDPGFAGAHLFLALQNLRSDPSDAQEHFQTAYSHRVKLSPRDAVLLDALEPLLRSSVDPGEAETRLLAATAKDPKEPLFVFLLGFVRLSRSEFELARDAFEKTIALDDSFIPAWRWKGEVQKLLGNVDAALEAYDQCIRKSPAAAICLEQRILIRRDLRGDCAGMDKDARAWQSLEPEASDASYYVAAALAALHAPQASIESALRRQWDLMPVGDRPAGEAEDRANLAISVGDFVAAERYTRAWDLARTKSEIMLHAGPQHQLALLAYESGDTAAAGKIAADFLSLAPAMTPDPQGHDPSVWAVEYLFRANRLKKDELNARRKAWIDNEEARRANEENRRRAPFNWATVYAGFAENLDEAKEALEVLPQFLPFPPDSRHTPSFDAEVGKAFALAGRYDEAVPLLKAVTRACIGLGSPQLQTRAFYFLGAALEGKGDLEGARLAYQTVVDRWGAAKPRSVTAERARLRLAHLE